MWYVRCYKLIYLLVIISNFLIWLPKIEIAEIFNFGDGDKYLWTVPNRLINLFAILINTVSFVLLEFGVSVAVIVEKMLSIIRMFVLFLHALIVFMTVLVMFTPTGFFWYHAYIRTNLYIYIIIAILFALEFLYFMKLSSYKGEGSFQRECNRYKEAVMGIFMKIIRNN